MLDDLHKMLIREGFGKSQWDLLCRKDCRRKFLIVINDDGPQSRHVNISADQSFSVELKTKTHTTTK